MLPLDKKVTMNDIAIHTQGRLDGVHLGAVVAGRDVDQGVFDLDATNDGLKANGRALLASIPARLEVAMDFRGGPPTQVVQSITDQASAFARDCASGIRILNHSTKSETFMPGQPALHPCAASRDTSS